MKYAKFLLIAWILLIFRIIGLSQSDQLFLHPVVDITMADLQQASHIMEARLEKSQVHILSSDVRDHGIKLHLRSPKVISNDNLQLLVTAPGNLEFRETIDRTEFFKVISENDPILKYIDRYLVPKLPEIEEFSAMLAEIKESDLKIVKYHLERLRKQEHFKGIEFAFGIKNKAGKTRLYSLDKQKPAALNRKDIAKIDLVPSPDGQGTNISLEFTPVGAEVWKDMTHRNRGKAIAITLDDVLLMAPKVLEEVTGGRAQISGLWGDGGDQVLYSILKTEILPAAFEVQ